MSHASMTNNSSSDELDHHEPGIFQGHFLKVVMYSGWTRRDLSQNGDMYLLAGELLAMEACFYEAVDGGV